MHPWISIILALHTHWPVSIGRGRGRKRWARVDLDVAWRAQPQSVAYPIPRPACALSYYAPPVACWSVADDANQPLFDRLGYDRPCVTKRLAHSSPQNRCHPGFPAVGLVTMEHHAREEIEESLLHAIPRELPQYIDDAVFLEVQELLANHPDNPNRAWSASPRLYTLLRILGHHDDTPVFHKFEAEQIGDFWLPLGPSILSQLSASVGLDTDEWRRAQYHVLSRPEMMGGRELLSPVHAHRYIRSGSSYFEPKATIGAYSRSMDDAGESSIWILLILNTILQARAAPPRSLACATSCPEGSTPVSASCAKRLSGNSASSSLSLCKKWTSCAVSVCHPCVRLARHVGAG